MLVFSLALFSIYLAFILIKYYPLDSISESYYRLKNKAIFTLVLWGFSIPLIVYASHPLIFLAASGICFVGAAAEYKQDLTDTVHVAGAVSGIFFGLLYIAVQGLWWLVGVYFAGFILLSFTKRKILWIEAWSFYVILYGIYLTVGL